MFLKAFFVIIGIPNYQWSSDHARYHVIDFAGRGYSKNEIVFTLRLRTNECICSNDNIK